MMTRVLAPEHDRRTITEEQWAVLRELQESMRSNSVVGNVQTLAAEALEVLFGEVRRLRSYAEAAKLHAFNEGYDTAIKDYGSGWAS